jgi:hypothetical protein
VRIAAGAFADGLPQRDLHLSPDHAVFIDGVLVPIRLLLNSTTIAHCTRLRHIHYVHVELDQHDILLAEGLPAESYLDTGNRRMFANSGEPILLHPEPDEPNEQTRRDAGCCAKLAVTAEQVEPIWQRLAVRAAALGRPVAAPATVTDPQLRLSAGGHELKPVRMAGDRYVFVLPPGTETIRIISRASAPADLAPWLDDRRRLGVSLGRIILHHALGVSEIPIDHPSLTDGWHDVELDGGRQWRWTNGRAQLTVPVGTRIIELRLAASTVYPAETVPIADALRA